MLNSLRPQYCSYTTITGCQHHHRQHGASVAHVATSMHLLPRLYSVWSVSVHYVHCAKNIKTLFVYRDLRWLSSFSFTSCLLFYFVFYRLKEESTCLQCVSDYCCYLSNLICIVIPWNIANSTSNQRRKRHAWWQHGDHSMKGNSPFIRHRPLAWDEVGKNFFFLDPNHT